MAILWFTQVVYLGLIHDNDFGRITPSSEFTIFGPNEGFGPCGNITPGPNGFTVAVDAGVPRTHSPDQK
jgi:hypothetical protein